MNADNFLKDGDRQSILESREELMQMKINYKNEGDVLIPDLKVPDSPKYPIGIYGRMRRTYLKNHRRALYSSMMIQGSLLDHLVEIDKICNDEFVVRVKAMAKA